MKSCSWTPAISSISSTRRTRELSPDDEDDFAERFATLKAEFEAQLKRKATE
jgi:hypothetical protein